MQLSIDPAGGPIYEQIANQVQQARDSGALVPGERLPSVRELAAQIGLNRNTVARAYQLLRERGVLSGRTGQGTRITAPAPPEPGAEALLRFQGSHDFALDLLARRLRATAPSTRLLRAPVGSTAGLLALGRGEAQLAGLHLLDPASGEYNRPALRQLLPGADIRMVTLAEREQGLIVRRGNPLALRDMADLARPEVHYAARQPGSGTSVLLEHLLARRGLSLAHVARPSAPLDTHLAVAAAVAGGRADAGLGLRAAARALDLDFIPLASERYDLAFWRSDEERDWLAALLETLTSSALRADIDELAGYDTTYTGWITA